MSETSTAAFARPRTANPKLESLNLIDAQIHSHPSFNVPSPPATQRGIGEGSVIWSQDMVPVEELSRPHTSNPRYVEMTTQKLETPRRSSPPQNHDTPSRASQADTTSAVLWASDAQDISPAMLARPLTSNPWLTRFLDGAPGDVKAASDGRRSGVEILWSDKEIEDWRLLARPHASNPVYEASVEASRNEMKPVTNVSAVLWSSDEMSSDEVIQLRALVQSQQYRIGELEAHVAMLQDQISALAVAAGKTPVVQSVDILRFPSANDLTATQELVEVITAISPSNVAAPPGPTPNTVRTTRPTPSPRPRSTGSGGVDDHSPRNVPLTRASTALGHREDEDEVVVAHDPAATQEHEPDVVEDDGDTDDSAFIKVVSEKPTNSRFAQRLRETTSGLQQPVRPDTAGAARPAPLYEGTVAPPRPSSAPVARKRFDAVPASFPTLVSQAIVAEDSIMKAYDALRVPGNPFVSKESFRKYYTARAAEFGTPCTKSMLDRLLRPYKSKGEDVLSLEEFAVLYLQFQRW